MYRLIWHIPGLVIAILLIMAAGRCYSYWG